MKNLEINTMTEMKNSFSGLISRLDSTQSRKESMNRKVDQQTLLNLKVISKQNREKIK